MGEKELESANVDMWHESLQTSIPSFFGVVSDVVHVLILIRFLTQEEVGLFFVCYAFLYLFSQIPRGFGIGIRKKASEVNEGRAAYLWSGFILILPTLFLVFILFLLSQPLLKTYASIDIPLDVLFAFYLATFGFSVLEFSRYYVAGCGKPAIAEKLRTGIAKTTMPILTVLFLSFKPTVTYALYAVSVSYIGTSIIIFTYAENELKPPTKEILYDILLFSKWSILTSILNDFYRRFDTIMLSAFVGAVAVSYYDSSLRIAFLSATFAVGISKTSNVKMSGLVETNKDITEIASKTIVVTPLLILPLLLVSLFNAEFILSTLYSPEYKSAKIYFILLIIVELFQGYRLQFESIFNSYNMPEYNTRISLASVILNIITAPPLVIYFGGLGVLYSTILAEILRLSLFEFRIKKIMNQFLLPKATVIQFLIFAVLVILLHGINLIFQLNNITSLVLSSIFATIVFYSVLYKFSNSVQEIVKEYKNEK